MEDDGWQPGYLLSVYLDRTGRTTKVKLPYGSLRRVLFDVWMQEFWDEHDLAADSDCTVERSRVARGSGANHRGRLGRQWDTAGRVEVDAYDFNGNPLSSTRRFWDWEAEGEQLARSEDLDTWDDVSSEAKLEAEEFAVSQSFGALNRPTTQTTPDGSITEIGNIQVALFGSVGVKPGGSTTLTPSVVETTGNARGQREHIDYGNGVSTSYSYDTNTFRLNTMEAWRHRRPRIGALWKTHCGGCASCAPGSAGCWRSCGGTGTGSRHRVGLANPDRFKTGNKAAGIPDVHHHMYDWSPGTIPPGPSSDLRGDGEP